MEQDYFTLATLATIGGSAAGVRIFVEYTKDYVGALFPTRWGKMQKRMYALLVSYLTVYGVALLTNTLAETWFAHIFNGVLVAVMAGAMQKPKAEDETR